MSDTPRTSFRAEWNAHVPLRRLREAADNKATYHRGRESYWKDQEDSNRKAYEESIRITRHEVTGGAQHGVEADMTLAQRLSQSEQKRKNHYSLARSYEQWVAFFDAFPDANSMLWITIADASYFGLGLDVEEPEDG